MSKVVIITEDMNREINDLLAMTQFKFKANIRKFLAALLEDPTGAEPGAIFTHNGLDKNKLIKALVDSKVITKKMSIDDHDENGNPHTAKMIVKYSVPKERFNERLDALYDTLFPDVDAKINESLFETDPYEDSLKIIKNSPLTMGVISGGVNSKLSPEYGMGKFFDDAAKALNKKIEDKKLDEEGGGATSCSGVDGNGFGSGEFTVPAFGKVIRRKKKEVGGNPYTLGEKVVRISEAQARLINEAVTGEDAEKAAAIYAYCLDDKEEDYCILCAKRLEGDEKGKWNPPMGHLHVGESPKDGAVRECEEESGVKIPKSQLHLGSTEDWGKNYWVILDGTIKDWPVGEGDGENSKFEWKNVYGLFYGKDKDLEWAWSTKDFVYKFAPAELDLDESTNRRVKILNEGYWGHLPLQNDSALDEFAEVAYNNIEEQLKNIDKAWGDKLSVFTYLGVIMYMLQIYNFFYSLKSLDKELDFTNKINKAIKYLDDEKFINTWGNPDEVKEYIKKLPDTIKEILDKNSLGSDNFKKLKVTVPCNEGKNYVNMDVDVRNGGRYAVKMTEDEFKQEMIHAYHMYAMEQEKKYKDDLQLTPSPYNFVYSLCYNNKENEESKYASALYNDIWNGKYKFDSENVNAYGGIKISKKGFPYIQCAAGGDWECPVCFFVYFDGNKFRGYVPLKGNAINRSNNTAFQGSGDEEEAKFIAKENDIDYEEAKSLTGDIDYNADACLEDFLSRVEVKGTYKKRDYTKDEEKFKAYRKEKLAEEERQREEAERTRQENEKQKESEFHTVGPENEITEATATGTGGLPGEFTVPFPTDKDDPSLDRTPGDTMGMHDRVGKSNLEESVVTLPAYLYHKSPRAFRKSILANGLLPKVGDSYQCYYDMEENLQPLIFLYDHNTIDGGEYDSTYDDDIYRIDTSYLDKELLNDDPAGMNGCFTYPEPIPSEALTLVYEGSDEDSDDLSRHSYIYNVHEGKKRKKVVKNDEGETVPEFCKKCGGKVGTYICGEPIYKCSECGEYYGTMPFKR